MDDFERLVRDRAAIQRNMPLVIAILNEGIDQLSRAIAATLEPYKNLGVFCQETQAQIQHASYGSIVTKSVNVVFAGPLPLTLSLHPSATETGKLGVFVMQRIDLNFPHYCITPTESERYSVWKWRLSKRGEPTMLLNDEEVFSEDAFKKAAHDLLTI